MTQDVTDGADHSAQHDSPQGVGAELRARREALSLTVAQVAAQTRITSRHIEMIERSAFHELPARTYAVGFTRNYAKLLELDELEIVSRVRAELDSRGPAPTHYTAAYEPADPARTPTRGLFWLAIVGAALIIAAAVFFMRNMFAPAAELPSLIDQQEAEQSAAAQSAQAAQAGANPAAGPAAAASTGPVVFTALEEGIWVKFYDGAGRQLMQKQMAKGETYTIPADAEGPQLWTGRPDALSITIGGKAVAPLATEQKIMRDIAVDAASLAARATPAVPAAAASAPVASAPAAPAAAATAR